ncbi:MAG: hypothetical protein ABW214_06425 [Terrimicrobiaceae bacterium]
MREPVVAFFALVARPEVFPSGTSRRVEGGRKAYITRIGAPASRTDLGGVDLPVVE